MRKRILIPGAILFVFSLISFLHGCSKDEKPPEQPSDIWDIDKSGIPKFVETNYIELEKIYRISKYRSSVGHDYSDQFEQCRSMKHYFEPHADADWTSIKIYSPVTGIITRVEQEWAGTKLEIASDKYPAFRFSIFHVNTLKQYNINDKLIAGEQLGTHIGSETMSDISVIVNDPSRKGRMVSYFDVITDEVFTLYANRGVVNREAMIIPKTIRDSNPLSCNGDTFQGSDILENWVMLN